MHKDRLDKMINNSNNNYDFIYESSVITSSIKKEYVFWAKIIDFKETRDLLFQSSILFSEKKNRLSIRSVISLSDSNKSNFVTISEKDFLDNIKINNKNIFDFFKEICYINFEKFIKENKNQKLKILINNLEVFPCVITDDYLEFKNYFKK